MKIFPFRLACENSQHFTMPPKVSPGNDVWEMSTEISYWWCITTQIWVVLLIGWSKFYQQYDQSEALPRSWLRRVISMELLHSFLRRNSVGGKRGGGGSLGVDFRKSRVKARGVIWQVPSAGVVWIFSGTTQYYDLQLQCGISKCFIWWMLVHMVAEVYTRRNQIYKTSCPSLIVA